MHSIPHRRSVPSQAAGHENGSVNLMDATSRPLLTHQFLGQNRLGLPKREPERVSWNDEEVPPCRNRLQPPRRAVIVRLGAVPIPSVTGNLAAGDASVKLGPDSDTETQKERVNDRVAHSHTSRRDVPAGELQRSAQDDVTGQNKYDGG